MVESAMAERTVCPQCGATEPAFRAVSDAVLQMSGELSLLPTLKRIAEVARVLVDARYVAIGVPDGDGGFAEFATAGMTAKQWDAIGTLPRTHGLLGAMLEAKQSYRTMDITDDPRFEGWPDAHPHMKSFLGVPIVWNDDVVGAFYLTDKRGRGRRAFTQEDQELVELLAVHAGVAINNASLYERSRELSIVEERNRLARELHDAVSQRLFSIALTAEAAALLSDVNDEAKAQMRTVQELARQAMDEMRSLIFELRPADVATDGLAETLRKHVDVLRRVHGASIELHVDESPALAGSDSDTRLQREVFRIAQEALANALKHAGATEITVDIGAQDHRLVLRVADDGAGFEPTSAETAGRHLGLLSMNERAQALGGELRVETRPGAGTSVSLEVPVGS
jgi:signal transduction histidine kinase